jgi:hypothetical protein
LTPPAAVGIIREITVFNPTQSGSIKLFGNKPRELISAGGPLKGCVANFYATEKTLPRFP